MTEQLLRDRLADTEKYLEKFAALSIEIAILRVAVTDAVSKGLLSDEQGRLADRLIKEIELRVERAKTEMQTAFEAAIEDAFSRHAERNRKELRLYTRIGLGVLALLLFRDLPTAFMFIKPMFGLP